MVDLNENSNKSTLETDIQILLLSHASSHLYILHYSKWEKDHALSTLFDQWYYFKKQLILIDDEHAVTVNSGSKLAYLAFMNFVGVLFSFKRKKKNTGIKMYWLNACWGK